MLNIFLPQKHLPLKGSTVKERPRLMESPEMKIELSKYVPYVFEDLLPSNY